MCNLITNCREKKYNGGHPVLRPDFGDVAGTIRNTLINIYEVNNCIISDHSTEIFTVFLLSNKSNFFNMGHTYY